MKDNKILKLLPLLVGCFIIAIVGALLVMMGPGLVDLNSHEFIRGYGFIFESAEGRADGIVAQSGLMIAAFVLFLIAAAFELIALLFTFGKGGKKLAGGLLFLSGLMVVINAVFLFLSPVTIGKDASIWAPAAASEVSIGWGYLVAGILSAIAGVGSLLCGVIAIRAKER